MPSESEIAAKHTFSTAFENTMQKLIQSEENRNKSKKLKKFSFRLAVALVSIFSTLIILAVCASAFHIDIFAEISRFAEKYLSIEFSSNKKEGNGVIYDTSSIPSDWERE
jgi:nucleoside recognition membrane protein YjiH